MLITSPLRSPSRQPGRAGSSLRRILLAIAAISALLIGTVPAPASADEYQPDYDLHQIRFGTTEAHRLVLVFRTRHPEITPRRNVAVLLYRDGNEAWAVVTANVGAYPNSPKNAPIDIYKRTAAHPDGWTLTAQGRPVDWREHPQPSDEWTVAQRPEIDGAHAEQIAGLYLTELGMAGAVYLAMSERSPCDDPPNRCIRYLDQLEALEAVQYLTSERGDKGDRVMAELLDVEWRQNNNGAIGPFLDLFSHRSPTPARGAVVGTLNGASDDLGGVDFSTLELRYLSDPGDGQGLQYAFHADASSGQDPDLDTGRTAALHASDAFFVWLSLPTSTFWVNLHPHEPDRIIDPALASTDVGRILLEADLQLKRTEAELIHPDTELGQQYWAAVEAAGSEPCMSARMWIVPAPATVYEQDGGLYILDAPLEVKMEAEGMGPPTGTRPTDDPCHRPEGAPEPPHERFSRDRVLPLIEQAVNEAPEYAELRQVYLARVAAEWYRERSRHTDTSLSWLINSGDVTAWPAMQDWSPDEVFDDYVESFTEGEFNVRREVQQGSDLYEVTYFFGGVDLATVPYTGMDEREFQADWADLPDTVNLAVDQPATILDDGVWLGGTADPAVPDDLADPARRSNNVGKLVTVMVAAVILLIVAGVGITIAVVLTRGRTRPQTPHRQW